MSPTDTPEAMELDLLDLLEQHATLREKYPEAHPEVLAVVSRFTQLLRAYQWAVRWDQTTAQLLDAKR